jgi:hypothetical protein
VIGNAPSAPDYISGKSIKLLDGGNKEYSTEQSFISALPTLFGSLPNDTELSGLSEQTTLKGV